MTRQVEVRLSSLPEPPWRGTSLAPADGSVPLAPARRTMSVAAVSARLPISVVPLCTHLA